ncbi:MAG TPA: secretion protein [Acetobacteraceae bacterium]|jgi:outer membrane protein|nr:secretion protein [Acetobacteraceae bacterium]
MGLRYVLLAGFSLVAIAATADAQTPPKTPADKPVKVVQATTLAAAKAKPAAAPVAHANLPHTLSEALAATYSNQPALQAERAKLRATDENVPTALAGWRPTVVLGGTAGYGDGLSRSYFVSNRQYINTPGERDIASATATVTQNVYNGGKTQGNVNRAKSQVMAERATLIAQEQTSFNNTVGAYVGVIQAKQLLELQINNEQVLAKQLQATNDRFRVGEITRTDVAQAEAALAGAQATRETAMGNLATARGTFQQYVGVFPPDDLVPPQPLDLPVHSEQEAATVAGQNNPNVITALFNDAAAKDAVDVAFATLLPSVSVQGQTFQQQNSSGRSSATNGYQVVAQLSVPVYQGGSEYAGVRQAKQAQQQTQRLIDDAKRTAVQNAVQAWDTLAAAKAAADSTRAQIRANEIALEGVQREAIVGSRTTLDVLNATQSLLTSRTTLVQNLAQVITASYGVAVAIGRLTARDLHLPVPLYDETAYYQAVKDRWAGLSDYATNQPGR